MAFSIIISLYNKENHVERAVHSVLNQSFKEFELIIVNDGSTDGSFSVVSKIKDNRIRLINKENGGVSSARNKGIEDAKHQYIGFLDADDAWKPNFLEIIGGLIREHPEAGAFATAYEIINQNRIIRCGIEGLKNDWHGIIDDYYKLSLKRPLITASSVVIPKAIFNKIGGFQLDIKRGEDLDMWRRIALNYNIAYSNQVCATYYHDAENRACKIKFPLKYYFINYAEDHLINAKQSSIYYEEYLINRIITKARYLIEDNQRSKARRLLLKYKHTRYNKKNLIKTLILSLVPGILLRKITKSIY